MSAPAATPTGPRNLALPLAAWLRKLGFTVSERTQPHFAAVEAHWVGPAGERFQLDYVWSAGPVPDATCCLGVLYAGQGRVETLFTPQKVRRLREARLLLLHCVRYANARMLATLTAANS
ncbi:MAG: hypothetical protein ACRYFZ_18150 [Janthinobacterium lividum]